MPTRQLTQILQHLRRAAGPPGVEGLTDGQLLERFIRHRDETAFTALVARHGPMVWSVCRRILGDHHRAEDAFQATFLVLVLVRRAAAVRPREAVGNWLYGVAHQTSLKARATAARRRSRERQVSAIPEPEAPQRDLGHDLQPLLDRELSRLPAKYRVPIVLCDLEGRPRKEVARQLGWPEGTLSGRLARARQALARRLTQRGVTVPGAALATALARDAASASVPPAVASATIRAAISDAAGQAGTGALAAPVTALTEGVLKDMLLTKLTTAAVVLLAVGLLALGGGLLSIPTAAGQHVQANQKEDKPARGEVAGIPKTDMEKLQGVWKVVSAESGGKPAEPEEIVFLVVGNRACWQSGAGETHVELHLDPTDRPKACDLTTGKDTLEGIYALDGNTLRLCFDYAEGAKRPRRFATSPGSSQQLMVMKRQKGFGSALDYRRTDGSKVFSPLMQALIQKAKQAPPRHLDNAPPPAGEREITGLQEQIKSLERRVAALEARLNMAPGARNKQPARVGQVIVVGNEKTPDSVIRNKLELFPGQVIDSQTLRAAEKRLAEFNATVTVVENDGDSAYRDILVTVMEK